MRAYPQSPGRDQLEGYLKLIAMGPPECEHDGFDFDFGFVCEVEFEVAMSRMGDRVTENLAAKNARSLKEMREELAEEQKKKLAEMSAAMDRRLDAFASGTERKLEAVAKAKEDSLEGLAARLEKDAAEKADARKAGLKDIGEKLERMVDGMADAEARLQDAREQLHKSLEEALGVLSAFAEDREKKAVEKANAREAALNALADKIERDDLANVRKQMDQVSNQLAAVGKALKAWKAPTDSRRTPSVEAAAAAAAAMDTTVPDAIARPARGGGREPVDGGRTDEPRVSGSARVDKGKGRDTAPGEDGRGREQADRVADESKKRKAPKRGMADARESSANEDGLEGGENETVDREADFGAGPVWDELVDEDDVSFCFVGPRLSSSHKPSD